MNIDINIIANECAELNSSIKKNIQRLNELKIELKNKMIKNNLKQTIGKNYRIQHTFYKNEFSSVLTKDFNNMGAGIIDDLIKSGLIAISYKLETKNYMIMKEKNTKLAIDPFVKKRKENSYLAIYTEV